MRLLFGVRCAPSPRICPLQRTQARSACGKTGLAINKICEISPQSRSKYGQVLCRLHACIRTCTPNSAQVPGTGSSAATQKGRTSHRSPAKQRPLFTLLGQYVARFASELYYARHFHKFMANAHRFRRRSHYACARCVCTQSRPSIASTEPEGRGAKK